MRFWLVLIVALAGSLTVSHAQPDATDGHRAAPPSGRYAFTVPPGWVSEPYLRPNEDERLVGETLYLADSDETWASWQRGLITGTVMRVELLPLALFNQVGLSLADLDDAARLRLGLGASLTPPTYTTVSGYPAATRPVGDELPFDALHANWTIVLVGDMLYRIFSAAQADAGQTQLAAIIASFDPTVRTTERPPLLLDSGMLRVPMEPGWLLVDWRSTRMPFTSAALSESDVNARYIITPDEAMLDLLYQPPDADRTAPVDLPDWLILVRAHPALATDADALFTALQANLRADVSATVMVDDMRRADLTNVYGGSNRGVLALYDVGPRLYSVVVIGPAARWVDEVEPLAATILSNSTIAIVPTIGEVADTVGTVGIGAAAPNFTATGLDGERILMQEYRGRVVLVTFWATWCVPCHDEMPLFEAVAAQREDVVVLAINHREAPGLIRQFADLYDLTFPIVTDPAGLLSARFDVQAYPTTFVVDPNGIIRLIPRFDPQAGAAQVEAWIDFALEQ